MGQQGSKNSEDGGEREAKRLREKEEKERKKQEKKDLKKKREQDKAAKKQAKKDGDKKSKAKGSGGKGDDGKKQVKKGPHASQAYSTRTVSSHGRGARFRDGDDISLDPVDNSPAYEESVNHDSILTPPTPTQNGPDQLTLEEIKNLIARVKANDRTLTTLSMAGQVVFKRISNETREEIQGLLAEAFQKNTHVKRAFLSRNHLDDAFAVSLADALTYNTTLEILDLDGNEISGVGAQALANTLSINRTISELHLKTQDAKLGMEGEEALLAIMEQNKSLVKLEFDIVDDTLRDWVNKRLSDNLNRRSQSVEEDGSGFDLSQMQFVLTPLRLQVMALVTNNFDEKELDFGDNEEFAGLSDQEKTAVAGGLGMNSQILTANFRNTQLVDSFAHTLAMSLSSNDTLTSLNLESNSLTEEGVKAVLLAAKQNKTLKDLRIGTQSGIDAFGPECSKAALECVETNGNLATLVFKSQDAASQAKIEECLAKNAK